MTDDLATQAASIVRRARVGDQNAMALIRQVGKAARDGTSTKAKKAYALIQKYINKNPTAIKANATNSGGLFGFGGDVHGLAPAPTAGLISDEPKAVKPQVDQRKPLERGSLDRISDPDVVHAVILRACQYRNGFQAAAVALAACQSLSKDTVTEMGASLFGSEAASQAFFYGVKHCTDVDAHQVAKAFDDYLKKPFVVGQCVGRAWRIQAVRRADSRIGLYSPVAGWEMGE
jgi:hypothetical protein